MRFRVDADRGDGDNGRAHRRCAARAGTTNWSPSVASAAGSAPRAGRGASVIATLAPPVQVDGAMAVLTDLPLWVWWPGQVVTHRARSPRSYQWEFDGGITELGITLSAPTRPRPT